MPPLLLDRYRPTGPQSASSKEGFGLAALVAAAGEILAATGSAVGDERVSSAPDARTIRYYQSLGVLDRPLRHEGREVVYGYRHLLQAVATKLLQAEGYTLAQVQRALLGSTTEALERAVADALGDGAPRSQAAPPAPPAPAAPDLRSLLTREVAPGVIVTLDPRLVSDPDSLLARITHALTLPSGGSR
ncbi:MAG: MerR family transcriptional regulator [Myxococcota bacterium]